MSRELTDQERARRDNMEALRASGVDPYPAAAFERTHAASEILAAFDDQRNDPEAEGTEPIRARIAGRVMSKRVMGKAAFFHLQDASGQIQIYARRDDLQEPGDPDGAYTLLVKRTLDIGDFVGIEGVAFRTKMGEVSLQATSITFLAKALRPLPSVKEKDGELYNEVKDKEFRYRQRYVDLVVNPEVRRVFRQRAQLVSAMRRFLDEREYVEVETPALQPIYGGASARPFTTHHNALDMPLFLRIADELYLKRLIVGGFEGVYEIAKNFRNEGLSRFHNPEFTALELYVAFQDYSWMMDLTEELLEHVAMTLHGTPEVTYAGQTISFARPWPRRPLFDLITEYTGRSLQGHGRDELAREAADLGIHVDDTMGEGKLIDEIFGTFVEPKLIQPTFVIDYPVALSPLAKRHREHAGLVERFEVICAGKELCNAFSELNDPIDQRQRFESQTRLGAGGDDEAMQLDEDFLRALEYGMPPTAGLGVGIDRLTMVMTGQESIRDVILFPLMRPETGEPAEAQE
ncbi:lysine--tRNA ligase [soil metagenome]